MNNWNLRRVCDLDSNELRFHIREVFYDDRGLPWLYGDARLRDIVKYWRDWLLTPWLAYPFDFRGCYPSNEEAAA